MKRSVKALFLTVLMTLTMTTTALAEGAGTPLDAGFHTIGTKQNVEIRAFNGEDEVKSTQAVLAGSDESAKSVKYYAGAERLEVTYNVSAAEKGDQFVVLLVTGSGLPDSDNTICYIDQVAKGDSDEIAFNVYPMLPTELENGETEMSLYITNNSENVATVAIPLCYAEESVYEEAAYIMGDANQDNVVDIDDVMAVINHMVGGNAYVLSGSAFAAANMNGDNVVDIDDIVALINYIVKS